MTALRKLETEVTAQEVLEILPSFPQGIAVELAPLLEKTDIETYKHFLITMYHYTYFAEEQLIQAMHASSTDEMREYFRVMSLEERGHYLLAKKDFEEFGGNVEDFPAPPSVKNFRDYWNSLGKQDPNEFVGAMFVFENVAGAVGQDIIAMMNRLQLTKRQSRWLRVHLEADIGHGNEAFEMCQKCVADNPAAMLDAAQKGAIEWSNVFKHAFSNKG